MTTQRVVYAHVYVVWEEEEVGKTLQQQEGVVRKTTVQTLRANVHTCMASLYVPVGMYDG